MNGIFFGRSTCAGILSVPARLLDLRGGRVAGTFACALQRKSFALRRAEVPAWIVVDGESHRLLGFLQRVQAHPARQRPAGESLPD